MAIFPQAGFAAGIRRSETDVCRMFVQKTGKFSKANETRGSSFDEGS
jgi:hypothetical protein